MGIQRPSAHLRDLLASGEIAADGPSGRRRYRPVRQAADDPGATQSLQANSTPEPPDPGVYPVYDAIVNLGGATTGQLAAHTGLTKAIAFEQCRRLMRFRHITFVGDGPKRVWQAHEQA